MSNSSLFMEERRRTILEQLGRRGRVSVRDLSDLLRVSTVTIRQDLRALEDASLLERTHGGAVLPLPPAGSPERSFDVRLREHQAVKDGLARAAAGRVESGMSIAMDASTTVFAMLPYLKKLDRLLIITNSLMLAQHCLDSPQMEVYLPGGRLRRDSISLVGKPEELPDINLNLGFFGAHGIAPEAGITESSQEEVTMKQAMMRHCLQTYLLVDERKWGKVAPYTLGGAQAVSVILTPGTAPAAPVAELRAQGAQVWLVAAAE
ncbi:MAG: DeoR/GlpR family DNA-binding transcription regulator [Anaerolineae bacterium]|jgi:DeoR/GlpR family transcriptional regulator of sugar metabolism|nr:DeoR/GlpR family DNA-binding transcription regulator [Anaerolineae bacterium]